jgi:hypothetical protein
MPPVLTHVRAPWHSALLAHVTLTLNVGSAGSAVRMASCTLQDGGTVGGTSASGSATSASVLNWEVVWPAPTLKMRGALFNPVGCTKIGPLGDEVVPQRLWRSTKPLSPHMLTGGGVGGGVGGGSGGGEGGGGEGGGKGGGDGGGGNGGGEGGGEGGGGEGGGEGGGFGGGLGGGLRGDGAKAGERRTRKERRLDKEWNTRITGMLSP